MVFVAIVWWHFTIGSHFFTCLIFKGFHLALKDLGKSTQYRLESEVIHKAYIRECKGPPTGLSPCLTTPTPS